MFFLEIEGRTKEGLFKIDFQIFQQQVSFFY